MERERDGLPVTSMREIRVLQMCRHPNIVHLKKVVTGSKPDSIFLVFEYCSHDLGKLIDMMPRPFSQSEVKCLMLQVRTCLTCMHPCICTCQACLPKTLQLAWNSLKPEVCYCSSWRQWTTCIPTGSCHGISNFQTCCSHMTAT